MEECCANCQWGYVDLNDRETYCWLSKTFHNPPERVDADYRCVLYQRDIESI